MWGYKKKKYAGKRFGSYTIEAPIGQGRYGVCFLAKSDNEQLVTIKKFKPGMFKKNSEKNVFEAVILSKLKDKRVPEFLGVINEKGFYGFVLEFKQGLTVKEMLFKSNHEFSNEEIFNIGLKLIRIIKYLHENGVVHRDIRIPNVIIDNEEVYLIDFGLARWSDNQYPSHLDFSYLGDFLLYLLYSLFQTKKMHKKLPWHQELPLTPEKTIFLKRLFGIEGIYDNINDIERDFIAFFKVKDV